MSNHESTKVIHMIPSYSILYIDLRLYLRSSICESYQISPTEFPKTRNSRHHLGGEGVYSPNFGQRCCFASFRAHSLAKQVGLFLNPNPKADWLL